MRGHTVLKTIICGTALAMAAAPAARAQYGSDGTITFAMHEKDNHGKTGTMTQYTRGQKIRMEAPDSTGQPVGAWIIDGTTSTMTILLIPNKKYIQITPQTVKDAAAAVKPTADSLAKVYGDSTHKAAHVAATNLDRTDVKITKVGSETVAGVSCDVYHVTTTDEKGKVQDGELCAAKGVGFFMMSAAMAGATAGGFGGATNPAMQARYTQFHDVLADGRGIIKITSIDKGTKHVDMEATKIDRSTPPDELFQIPPGYTKFEMPSLKSLFKSSVNNTVSSESADAKHAADSASSSAADAAKKALKKKFHFP
jgi:hypothetical protein